MAWELPLENAGMVRVLPVDVLAPAAQAGQTFFMRALQCVSAAYARICR